MVRKTRGEFCLYLQLLVTGKTARHAGNCAPLFRHLPLALLPRRLAASVARLLLAFAFYDFNVGHTFAITQALAGPRDLGPAVRKM